MAASATPAKAPQYFTNRAQVKLGKGQALRFAKGKGYYAGDPVPADPYAGASAYGLTPAALRAMVNAEVSAQLGPQRTAINQAQAATDKQYANQQATLKALTESYRNLLSGIGGQVNSDYTNAGNAVADYAKGYSGAIQGQLNDAGNAEKGLLATAGAPDAQTSQALGHLTAPTDALYGMAGAVPAGALAREGAAMSAAADQLPAYAVGRGQENALQLSGAQQTADQQYRQQLARLIASVPSLRASAESSILSNAAKAQQLSLEEQAMGLKTSNQAFNQSLATDKYNLEVGKQKVSLAQWNAKQTAAANKIDPRVSAGLNDGFAHNAQGDVIHDAKGNPIKFTVPKTAVGGAKPTTQTGIQRFLDGLKVPSYSTVRKSDGNGGSVSTRVQTGSSFRMGYYAAYRRLRAMGLDDKTARENLQTVYERGQRGRGWLTNEEQAALKQAQAHVTGPRPANVTQAHVIKHGGQTLGYLTMQQALLLKEAGLLPPGEEGQVRGAQVWYINPKG